MKKQTNKANCIVFIKNKSKNITNCEYRACIADRTESIWKKKCSKKKLSLKRERNQNQGCKEYKGKLKRIVWFTLLRISSILEIWKKCYWLRQNNMSYGSADLWIAHNENKMFPKSDKI